MNESFVTLQYQDKTITLIKTAHISQNSVADVREAFDELHPDCICVELDEERYANFKNPKVWEDYDIVRVIKEKKVGFLMANIILSSFQKRMGENLNSQSGGEMFKAIELAEANNLPLVLADRSIKTTFSRIWHALSFIEKIKMIWLIISAIFDDSELSEDELTALKQSDALESALNEIAASFPHVKKVLVDERDQYLSQKIKEAPGKKILAIVGAAHAKGISENINTDHSLKELENTSFPKTFASYLKWLLPIALIAMVIYSFIKSPDVGYRQLLSWLLWNGSLSAIGVLLAKGHVLSILTAFIAAPITSLNPLLAAGWFAGIVEATLRKPQVKDFNNLAYAASSLKGLWQNRVTHILLVVILANIFSTIGTIVSGLDIVQSFFKLL